MVIRLLIEYDGGDFYGWQVQPVVRTVQGELLKALRVLFPEGQFKLVGASRTDRGVHAEGQVASLHTDFDVDVESLRQSLNGLTGSDILIKEAIEAEPDFNARYRAKGKLYRYRVLLGKSPLKRRFAWECPFEPDFDVLNRLASEVLGEHDFSLLSTDERGGKCNVRYAAWLDRGEEVHFEIIADRFLHKMVRILAGTMVLIASGRLEEESLVGFFRGRRSRVLVAPPHGLTLVRVYY
ncbi:MAG TPA: tRNA pseudouridine synthase A [candidate division WOR-3 bacterium]|uniref:tRNA pseudouridine synthase A n=1 Tax=candidate division WOR-3 bacterium TaxID=2052148 RepID=A0A7C1BAY6_UNCW3|nr:tRNA pseudouridine synthase A [candidate division WOR-3 bacterium]